MVVELASFESPQIKLIDAWDRALLAKDLDLAAKYLHKDFRRTTSPRSLGEPDKTKEEWFKAAAKLVNSPVDFSESIHHSVIADIPGRVVVHSTTKIKGPPGFRGADRESIVIVDIVTDEDGSLKIKQFHEFTDSKSYADFRQAIALVAGV